MAAVDKTYGDALFSLVTEEDEKALPDILGQLKGVSEVFAAEPDFIKLLRTPTIPIEEKTALVKEVFDGKVHKFVVNFLCILTENDRLPDFERILAYFTGLYNEKLGIADVTVTSAMPLSDTAAEKIRAKMAEITGKTVNMTLKTDDKLVGDKNGHVGAGLGKAAEIPEAIRKGKEDAMKKLVTVARDENGSITHDFIGKFGSAEMLLKRAPEGTGVIAGGPARAVIELAGIKNIRTKCMGSRNKQNVVLATIEGLRQLKTPEEVARLRGKSVDEILA